MIDFEEYLPLGQQIILTGLAIKEGLKKAFSFGGYDITNEHFALLLPLWKEDGQSQIELCEKTCKSKSNVTRILDNMEKRGLIARNMDKRDRRKFLVYLTYYAKTLQNPLTAIALKYGQTIMKDVSEEDMKQLLITLTKINENLLNAAQT